MKKTSQEILPQDFGWASEALFHQSQAFYECVLHDLSSAEHSIDIEVYIFAHDPLGYKFLEKLVGKAQENVRVRLLVDGIGSRHWSFHDMQKVIEKGVAVRIYNPVPWPFSKLLPRWSHAKKFLFLLFQMNRRDHKKLYLIDQSIAYLGSMNIHSPMPAWRETGVRLTGQPIAELIHSFEWTWQRAFDPNKKMEGIKKMKALSVSRSKWVRLNHNIFLRRKWNHRLLDKISHAQTRVWLMTPYFVPSPRLIGALRRAAMSGADVKVILPERLDVDIIKWVSRLFLKRLIRAGVKVFEYRRSSPQDPLPAIPSPKDSDLSQTFRDEFFLSTGMLHAKMALIDNWGLVGTSNLNYRSLNNDLEVDAVLCSQSSIQSLFVQFNKDLAHSHLIGLSDLAKMSLVQFIKARMALLIKKWL